MCLVWRRHRPRLLLGGPVGRPSVALAVVTRKAEGRVLTGVRGLCGQRSFKVRAQRGKSSRAGLPPQRHPTRVASQAAPARGRRERAAGRGGITWHAGGRPAPFPARSWGPPEPRRAAGVSVREGRASRRTGRPRRGRRPAECLVGTPGTKWRRGTLLHPLSSLRSVGREGRESLLGEGSRGHSRGPGGPLRRPRARWAGAVRVWGRRAPHPSRRRPRRRESTDISGMSKWQGVCGGAALLAFT